MTERTFDALAARTPDKPRNMCRACGQRPSDGIVRISAHAYGPQRGRSPLKNGKTVASLSVSMCEGCCVRYYERIADLIRPVPTATP